MLKRGFDEMLLMSPDEPPSGGVSGGVTGTGTPPGNGGQTPPTPPADPPKFTQADVDRLLGDRAKRAEEATQAKILESVGVKSLDDLKKIKEDADKARAAQLNDLQKAQQQAADEKARADKAEKDKADALAQATEMLMKSAVLAEATKADYRIRPEAMTDVWSFIKADKSLLDKIKAKEGGEPGEFTGVGDAVKELLKVKTYMVWTGDGQGTPRKGQRQGQQGREPSKDELDRASRMATHNKF